MKSSIKKLVCIYTHLSDFENSNILENYIKKNCDLEKNNITILKVIAGQRKNEFVKNILHLSCTESYDSLSIKTYEMIRMCTTYKNFDFLIKIDSSIVNYANCKNAGYSKRVRNFYYDLKRIKFLLNNDFNFRLYNDYGGLHLTKGGTKQGYNNWANFKKVKINYDKIFSNECPPIKYTGKLYFLSKHLCKEVMQLGEQMAIDHKNYLAGSEDTLVSRIYTKVDPMWYTQHKYQSQIIKFENFRKNKNKARLKSLYIIDHSRKFIWYVNPKVASRTISKHLNLKFPEKYKNKKEFEVIETYKYLPYEKYYDYFKFTFVRNPYDRLLSTFLDKTKKVINTPWEIKYFAKFKDYTFEQFVEYLYKNVNLSDNNVNRHIRTQMSLANDANDLNFVGKIENFQNDINYLSHIIGIPSIKLLENKNKTDHDHYSTHYSSGMKKMVYEMYFEDFVKFGYGSNKS